MTTTSENSFSDVVAHSSRLLPGAVAPGDQRVFSPRPRCLGKRSVRGNG